MPSTSFPVSTKPVEKFAGGGFTPAATAEDIADLAVYTKNNCSYVLLISEVPTNSEFTAQCFINTVIDAYCYHHNLIIRPDDIWFTMMTQFAFYIRKNSQDLRDKFANIQGKQAVAIALPGGLNDLKVEEFIKLISDEVDKNVNDDELKAWILPKFSTTTVNDTVASGLAFMASVNKYSGPNELLCGIPNVTLEGTFQDWQTLLNKLEKLKEYNLDKWYDLLKPVIQEFVNAKEGKVDTVFWQRICHYEPNASATSYLSGWITVFCVFDKDGNWMDSNWTPKAKDDGDESDEDDDDDNDGDTDMDLNLKEWLRIDLEKIPDGLLEINVELKDSSDAVVQTLLMAGHMGVEVKEDGETIMPIVGWALARKSSSSDKKNNDEFDGALDDDDADEVSGGDEDYDEDL